MQRIAVVARRHRVDLIQKVRIHDGAYVTLLFADEIQAVTYVCL